MCSYLHSDAPLGQSALFFASNDTSLARTPETYLWTVANEAALCFAQPFPWYNSKFLAPMKYAQPNASRCTVVTHFNNLAPGLYIACRLFHIVPKLFGQFTEVPLNLRDSSQVENIWLAKLVQFWQFIKLWSRFAPPTKHSHSQTILQRAGL